MKDRIILIFGRTGSGKTTLAKDIIKDKKRVVVIDPMQEYNHRDAIIFDSFEELTRAESIIYSASFFIICRFTSDLEYQYLFELVWILKDLTLVVEECEIYVNPNQRNNSFLKLVRYGRHKKISLVGIARRPSELSIDFRAQGNKIITLKQTENRDLEILEKIGFASLQELENFVYSDKQKVPVLDLHYKEIEL